MFEFTHHVWSEKYRPQIIDDCILPKNTKSTIKGFIESGQLPSLLLHGPAGTGKAQPLYAKVLTPSGWTTIGSLKIGDDILTPNGTITKVVGVYPQGKKDIFEITFSDGAKTKACAEHLWECYVPRLKHRKSYAKDKVVISTADIKDFLKLKSNGANNGNISIDLISPYNTSDVCLPLNPYLLGVLLGDGGLTNKVNITSIDDELILKCNSILQHYDTSLRRKSETDITYMIVQNNHINYGGNIGISKNPIKTILSDMGLIGKKSYEKAIPDIYKTSSISQKLELIKGLMDTDGCAESGGATTYSTSSPQLAKDIQDLIWSIGGKCSISTKIPTYTYKCEKKKGRMSYILHISYKHPKELFSLKRKVDRCRDLCDIKQYKRIIKSIEYVENTEAVCIMVDDINHLYITDDYIITHNTTLAKAICNELDYDYLMINGSNEGRLIDTLRNTITQFASTVSFEGKRKCVIIDEADYMTTESVQPAFRNFMDEFSKNCTFILTCNFPNRIIDPIHSRCASIDFTIPQNEQDALLKQVVMRIFGILKDNNVTYDKVSVGKIVKKFFPDFRRTLNELQQLSAIGPITPDSITALDTSNIDDLVNILKAQNFTDMRKWVASTPNIDISGVCKKLYNNATNFMKTESIPQLVLHLADYQYKDYFVADKEINLAAMLLMIMSDCEFKV